MSGQNVPYQLRPNKFVERQLFLDIMDYVRVWQGHGRYVYCSMGGRFLEDLRSFYDRFEVDSMISFEEDPVVYRRQKFNVPVGTITCMNCTSGEFIKEFPAVLKAHANKFFVVWLDYATANERLGQLNEFRDMVSYLSSGDVVRVTVNANVFSHTHYNNYQRNDDFFTVNIAFMREQLGDYAPDEGVTRDHMQQRTFARLVCECVKRAALRGTANKPWIPVPLTVALYQDGEHPMLTITCVLADADLEQKIRAHQPAPNGVAIAKEWTDITTINVPDLSPKERIVINQLLTNPVDLPQIVKETGELFSNEERESFELLKCYLKHHRRYPAFSRTQ